MTRCLPLLALLWTHASPAFGQREPLQGSEPASTSDGMLRDHLWRELTRLPRGQRPTVGLALSAGATRAVAHVGVLQVLDDAGFPVDVVSGTSMGAVIGALYADGAPLPKLWGLAEKFGIQSGSNLNRFTLLQLFLLERLLSSKGTEEYIQEQVGGKYFHQLPKPFACVAMDIKTGEAIVFREGPLAPAVRASVNLPGLFAPVEYRHRYLVDGGVVDYIPIDAARLLGADWVLASVTEGDYTLTKPNNVLATLEQVIDIRGALLSREQRKRAQMVIEPQVGDILFYETDRSQEAIEKGVRAAQERLGEAKENLLLFSLPWLVKRWGAKPGGSDAP